MGSDWKVRIISKKLTQLRDRFRKPLYVFCAIGAIGFGLAAENPWLVLRVGDLLRTRTALDANFRQFQEPETVVVHPAKIRAGIVYSMGTYGRFC